MALRLFYDGMSQPSRSLLLLLKCANVEFQPGLINIAKGEHLSEEFRKVNPSSRVPALQDGEFKLSESTAMMKYICATRNLADHWYPKDLKKRAKLDEFLAWHHLNLRMGAAMYFRTTTLIPLLTGSPPKDGSKYLKILNSSMDTFENYYLKDTPFIFSDEISIADLMAVTEFSQLEVMGPKAPELTQCVKDWMERCIKETDPHYSEIHKIVLQVKQKFAKL